MQLSFADLTAAADIVYSAMPATPQYRWPLLCERLGTEIWLKHENHTPVGAFKIRGGLVYFARLSESQPDITQVISATRGNHGQSVGFAARRFGLQANILVPHGNSQEKNAAMRALDVELIEHGDDFQQSVEEARRLAAAQGMHMIPSFHPWLIAGVASYSLELFAAVRDIDVAYVPIGQGSGICGMLAARDALGLSTEIVGVASSHAPAHALSFAQKEIITAPTATELADGMATSVPVSDAMEMIWAGVDRVVQVSDDEIAAAMRDIYECTHNIAEGAGAAAYAAAKQERSRINGKRVAAVLSGGNIDRALYAQVLASA